MKITRVLALPSALMVAVSCEWQRSEAEDSFNATPVKIETVMDFKEAIAIAQKEARRRGIDVDTVAVTTMLRANHWIISYHSLRGDGSHRADTVSQFYVNVKGRIVKNSPRDVVVTAQKAIDIARTDATTRGIDVAALVPTTQLKANLWIVTFPFNLPPGTLRRGPDYVAQVWISARTGKVEEFMAG